MEYAEELAKVLEAEFNQVGKPMEEFVAAAEKLIAEFPEFEPEDFIHIGYLVQGFVQDES